jgi:hypothetical protein
MKIKVVLKARWTLQRKADRDGKAVLQSLTQVSDGLGHRSLHGHVSRI